MYIQQYVLIVALLSLYLWSRAWSEGLGQVHQKYGVDTHHHGHDDHVQKACLLLQPHPAALGSSSSLSSVLSSLCNSIRAHRLLGNESSVLSPCTRRLAALRRTVTLEREVPVPLTRPLPWTELAAGPVLCCTLSDVG